MKKSQLRQLIKEVIGEVNEVKTPKSKYVYDSSEEIGEPKGSGEFFSINKKLILQYLKQFNSDDVSAKHFLNDEEGYDESYYEHLEDWSDKEVEDAVRQDMSYYYFSKPDEI